MKKESENQKKIWKKPQIKDLKFKYTFNGSADSPVEDTPGTTGDS